MEAINAMLSTLRLVFPPVSSYEADSLKNDPEVEARIRTSDFYMIVARAESFIELIGGGDDSQVHLTVSGTRLTGEPLEDTVTLDVERLAINTIGKLPDEYQLEVGPKFIRFWPGHDDEPMASDEEPFEWFTLDKLTFDRGRGLPGIIGFHRYREFATYELLYVGIAKQTDTFDRLFDGAHHARQKMLSQEWPRRTGARITDELLLLPFIVDPTVFRTLAEDDVPTDPSPDAWATYSKKVVADAEKAFVKLLDPQYNVQKFASFPKGKDGLYDEGHHRYGYLLADNLTLVSGETTMRGAWDAYLGMFSDEADMIMVTGETVELFSGSQQTPDEKTQTDGEN